MRRPRLGPTLAALALALLAAGLAAFVPRASAIDPFPTSGPGTLSSDHFMIHYSTNDQDSTCTNFITQQMAGDVLGMLERVYKLYTDPAPSGWGSRRASSSMSPAPRRHPLPLTSFSATTQSAE